MSRAVHIRMLLRLDGDLSWQHQALCQQVAPDMFFPEKGDLGRQAKRVCQGCDVRTECLDYALGNGEEHGIWGGLSRAERNKVTRAAAS